MATDLHNHIGWGIIGTPDGMECKSGGCIEKFDIRRMVDLDNRSIEVLAGTEILSLFREIRNGHPVYYYLLYRYAREIRTGRPGCYYGSVLVTVSNTLAGAKAWTLLCRLSNYLETFLDANKRFKGSLAQIPLPEPDEISSIRNDLQPAALYAPQESKSCFIPVSDKGEGAAAEFFDQAMQVLSSGTYNRIYGSASTEIILQAKSRHTLTYIHKHTIVQNQKIEIQQTEIKRLQVRNEEELSRSKALEEEFRKELKRAAHALDQFRHENAALLKEAEHKLEQARAENSRLRKKLTHIPSPVQKVKEKAVHRILPEQLPALSKSAGWIAFALVSLVLLYFSINGLPGFRHTPVNPPAAPPVSTDSSLSAGKPAVKFSRPVPSRPDPQLQKLAQMYCEEVHAAQNLYNADTIRYYLDHLRAAGMERDSSYRQLMSIFNNYGLTGFPLSAVKAFKYKVQKGDNSTSLVLKHVKRSYPDALTYARFDTSFMSINGLQPGSRLKMGTVFTLLLPVKK